MLVTMTGIIGSIMIVILNKAAIFRLYDTAANHERISCQFYIKEKNKFYKLDSRAHNARQVCSNIENV